MTEVPKAEESKEKILKMVKVLKDLEDKIKKVLKDKNTACDFIKTIVPSQCVANFNFDPSAGTLEFDSLSNSIKAFKEEKRKLKENKNVEKEKNSKLEIENLQKQIKSIEETSKQKEEIEYDLRGKIILLEDKLRAFEEEKKKQENAKASTDANNLLAKLKKTGSTVIKGKDLEDAKNTEDLQLRISEQSELILRLKTELNKALKIKIPQEKQKVEAETQTINESQHNDAKAQNENLSHEYQKLKVEFTESRAKAQAILAGKEEEIEKLKESLRNQKSQLKINEKTKSVTSAFSSKNKSAVSTQAFSDTSLNSDEKTIKITQLEKEVANLNEVLNLHRQAEQDLNKKLRLMETSKTKEDVNYEYIKNVFKKYLIFTVNNSQAEAKQMELMILDLLHFNKGDREDLEKGKPKNSFFGFFSGKSAVIGGSYVSPNQNVIARSNSVHKKEQKKQAYNEISYSKDPRDDIDPQSINLENLKYKQTNKK